MSSSYSVIIESYSKIVELNIYMSILKKVAKDIGFDVFYSKILKGPRVKNSPTINHVILYVNANRKDDVEKFLTNVENSSQTYFGRMIEANRHIPNFDLQNVRFINQSINFTGKNIQSVLRRR